MANTERVTLDGLGDAIAEQLGLYRKEVQDKLNEAGQRGIERLKRETKATAPFNAKVSHKHYRDMIAVKVEETSMGDKVFTWYVKPPGHRLTHLLVHGHATRDGGRTRGDPFLQKALDGVLRDYEKEIEEALRSD